MRKIIILLVAIIIANCTFGIAQSTEENAPLSNFEKTEYLKEDLTEYLQKKVKYPIEALKSNIEGDVILSFVITEKAEFDSLTLALSPNKLISHSSLITFDEIANEWKPSKIDGKPVNKKYLVIFRYRIYTNSSAPDYKKRANKYYLKQKYDKALKYYNKAIELNKYDTELFDSRSKVNEILGNKEQAKQDLATSNTLKNEIFTVIDVAGLIKTKKRTVTTVKKWN